MRNPKLFASHNYLAKVAPESNFDESGKSQSPHRDLDMGIPSPTRGFPIKSNIKEIGGLGGSVHTSNVDTTTNQGEGVTTTESQGTSTIIISSSFDTSTIDTTVSLPSFHTSISTTLPQSKQSPTFGNILNQPITSLFPSQSTEGAKPVQEDETTKDGEFMDSFADIEFDQEEENIPDHMLMSRKQFNILNMKLNSLLKLQVDARAQNYVSGIEVDVMLKAQELQLRNELDLMNKNNENHVKVKYSTFNDVLTELKAVAKERHILFVQVVKRFVKTSIGRLRNSRLIWRSKWKLLQMITVLFIPKLI
ncbi:unnamed protein product [Lactuca saligna]|uniref:Uncharacterized protein n=1 Tax=Lactuca saligna TaxID=75948 RepID=A0AA36EFB5_LACSI|nr:unnamed protein product [Lactuca saligna]